MAKFNIEIPVRITRECEFAVDYEPTQECAIKFGVEADDEDEALELVRMLFFNEIEASEVEDENPDPPS